MRAIDAVLPNSVAAHCTLQDDWLPVSHSHIGAAVIPTALAVCEEEGRTGRELIEGIVAGYDVEDRVGCLSVATFARGFRPSSVYAYFGAAAAAGKLMRLEKEQMANALGCAGSMCGGVLQPWKEGSMEWSFQEAFASRSGIVAACLAHDGLSGSRSIFEGPCGVNRSFSGTNADEHDALNELGKHFHIEDTCFKRFPTGGANQGSASVAYSLRKKHSFDDRTITRVDVDIPKAGTHERMNYAGVDYAGPFHNFDQCLISKQFAIAMNLRTGDMRTADIEEARRDESFVALARKINLFEVADLHGWDLRMRIHFQDGSTIEGDGSDIDKRQLSLSWTDAVEKFTLVTRGISHDALTRQIVETINAIDTLDSITPLTMMLSNKPRKDDIE
jgi:2-methylcitrate dehydratase PrpD